MKPAAGKQQASPDAAKKPLIPAATIRPHKRLPAQSAKTRQNSNEKLPGPPQEHHRQQQASGPAVWSSVDDLFWDHMNEVQNKWSALKLNDDIWAKLIYFEQNRRLAKAYVSTPVLTVDGSTHGLDGFRIGLSGIDNAYRGLDSMSCLRSIGPGVKLKIDSTGNILIRRVSASSQQAATLEATNRCPVWVKDWSALSSAPAKKLNGGLVMHQMDYSQESSFKLFDMRKFRAHLDSSKLTNQTDHIDWRQCVSVISFGARSGAKPSTNILEDPCWIMLINIIAIEMIKSSLLAGRVSPALSSQPSSIDYLNQQHSRNYAPHVTNNSHDTKNTENTNYKSPRGSRFNNNNNHVLGGSSLLLFPNSSSSNLPDKLLSTTNTLSSINNNNNNQEPSKKLRGSRQRFPLKEISHIAGRQYQSIQQLPVTSSNQSGNTSSSTIYTTFQSKARSKHLNRSTTTADNFNHYNSGSPQNNTNYRARHLLRGGGSREFELQISNLTNRDPENMDKALFSRKSLVLGPEGSSTTTRSMSTIDLFSNEPKRRFEAIHSSIKINYDDQEDYEAANEFPLEQRMLAEKMVGTSLCDNVELPAGSQLKGQQRPQYRQSSTLNRSLDTQRPARLLEKQQSADSCVCENCKLPIVRRLFTSHSSSGGSCFIHPVDEQASKLAPVEVKASITSSIDSSSSSSSGCADNDYFMTQSSASVSSCSAASNEVTSQPPSSSGIVSSENPSEVYEDEQDTTIGEPVMMPVDVVDGNSKSTSRDAQISRTRVDTIKLLARSHDKDIPNKKKLLTSQQTSKPNRRKLDPKTIAPPFDCCCGDVLESTPERDEPDNDSLCPMVDCECHCYCLYCNNHPPKQRQQVALSDCDCGETLAEDRGQRLATSTSKTNIERHLSDTLIPLHPKQQANLNIKVKKSSTLDAKSTVNNKGDDKALSAPTNGQPKHSKGWLNRRNYGKILPKFIFSSSSNNSSSQVELVTSSKQMKKINPISDNMEELKLAQSFKK